MDPQRYSDALPITTSVLVECLLKDVPGLLAEGLSLDRLVKELLREVGRQTMEALYRELANHLVGKAQQLGFSMHENPEVVFKTLFGPVAVRSPYLRQPDHGQCTRPLREHFGVEGDRYSEGVQRALVDFGSEKSFDRAAKQFSEHYGFEVGRTTIRHRTLEAGRGAQSYVEDRLQEAQGQYEQPLAKRAGVATMVVELDGCEVRTGQLMTAAEAGRDDLPAEQVVRVEQWKEVRTGLVRPLEQVDSSYACQMASYPEISDQLFGLACERGLSRRTQVVAPGDGGNGLMEELAGHFACFQYILDRPHLREHLEETAEALEIEPGLRRRWVEVHLERVGRGEAPGVIRELQQLFATNGNDRVRRLAAHLERFSGCMHYDAYKAQSWPLGSGEIESAHRYLPQERLKIAGACWHPETINPMLALRVIRANGWWGAFWSWRAQQRQRELAA